MLDTLPRPRLSADVAAVPAAAGRCGRTPAPRDWTVTAPQHALVPGPRLPRQASAPPGSIRPNARPPSRTGRRDWAPTPVMDRLDALDRESTRGATSGHETSPRRPFLRTAAALALNAVLLAAVAVFVGLAVGPHTGHYRTLTMLTGSMRPEFPPGSVVIVTREPADELRPGDVITYHAPVEDRRVVTHRVVSIDRSGSKPVVTTKGDANAGIDPWEAALVEDHVWRARFAVPLLGDAIRLLRQPAAQVVATRVLPGVLLVWLLASIWRSGDNRA